MPPPFRGLTVPEFAELLGAYPFTREIREVHMHHTWRPNHEQDKGRASVEAMHRYHTRRLGWSDIAQHVTIDKEGTIWTGRDWNAPPASSGGHNGTRTAGPFMFEMIGDFDVGNDLFEGAQRETAIAVVALVQERFGLKPETLRFHSDMSGKTCPGSAIDYDEVLQAVREERERLVADTSDDDTPGGDTPATGEPEPFGPERLLVHAVLEDAAQPIWTPHPAWTPFPAPRSLDDAHREAFAEPPEKAMSLDEVALLFGSADGDARGDLRLSRAARTELKPHVINLTDGRLSTGGRYQTTPADVEAIFEQHLPDALAQARERKKPLHVMLYAHGGLVSEKAALEKAYTHVNWWKETGTVYPIYFVWETGLFETIAQALRRWRRGSRALEAQARGWLDGPIEAFLRYTKLTPAVWQGMKLSAAAGSAEGGGAHLAAQKLAGFAKKYRKAVGTGDIRFHAVGHSAGSIFHSHFVPAALKAGVPSFRTVQVLAPAIRTDRFAERFAPLVGEEKGIDHLSLFTMSREAELDDHCARVYRKSLLYLVYYALERERKEPILGLEENLLADPALVELFGLDGSASPSADAVFGPTRARSGRSATRAESHGAFDDDPETMQSVMRRVLDAPPGERLPPYPQSRAQADPWTLPPIPPDAARAVAFLGAESSGASEQPPASEPERPPASAPASPPPRSRQKRALCVGIDAYPTRPLSGAVADARAWADALRARGFEVEELLDERATRSNLLAALGRLVGSGRPGDVLAFQFAGHGAQFDDLSGDEPTGRDQAYCPVDHARGPIILDDEVRELFDQLADGVNLTCFLDFCHSGSATRFAFSADEQPREIEPTPEMRAFRQDLLQRRERSPAPSSTDAMRDVTFSACQSNELAWEVRGRGVFSVRALEALGSGVTLTNEGFHRAVLERFRDDGRQHPVFESARAAETRVLLAPVAAAGPSPPPGDAAHDPREVVRGLHRAVQQFERALADLDR